MRKSTLDSLRLFVNCEKIRELTNKTSFVPYLDFFGARFKDSCFNLFCGM